MTKRYSGFPSQWINVPVQFGNLSARARRCYDLGADTIDGKKVHFFRIADNERGAGRFLYEELWWEGDTRYSRICYTSYYNLPIDIRNKIEGV